MVLAKLGGTVGLQVVRIELIFPCGFAALVLSMDTRCTLKLVYREIDALPSYVPHLM